MVRAAGVAQQAGEFVPAQAAHHIAIAQCVAHAGGDDAQHLVAGGMAVLIVDELEAIQVEHHHDHLPARSQRPFQAVPESRTVEQSRQVVMFGTMELPALAHLAIPQFRLQLRAAARDDGQLRQGVLQQPGQFMVEA